MTEQPSTNPQATPQTPESSAPEAAPAKKPVVTAGGYIWGTGRRKSAIARVRIRPGSGQIQINKRPLEEYFHFERDLMSVREPLAATNQSGDYDVWANVRGGGATGQAEAVQLGIARALVHANPELTPALREKGLLTRDARMKERKKYGQKGARKRFQFSKR